MKVAREKDAKAVVTPGEIAYLGRHLGADNDAVFGELLDVDADRLAALRAAGVI